MRRCSSVLLLALVVGFATLRCTPTGGTSIASLTSAKRMVWVDELPTDGGFASADAGIVGRYLLIASTDTNELRVLNLFRLGLNGRAYLPAPNPLEALSVPVVDRPQLVASDVGITDTGRRVTGKYVYTAAVAGTQLSVVDVSPDQFVSMTRYPLSLGTPLSAMVGWMGTNLKGLPATTRLYIATLDGTDGVISYLDFPTTGPGRGAAIAKATPSFFMRFPGEAVVSMVVLPPFARTYDGKPFCATSSCIAVALRKGATGRSLLIDLGTRETAILGFPGPLSTLSESSDGVRLYGVLARDKCDDESCGGVIGVDTSLGAPPKGFELIRDFTGKPMRPLGTSLYPRDVTVALGGAIYQTMLDADGGLTAGQQEYGSLGMFTTGVGYVVPFDANRGALIDFDGRRPSLSAAALYIPMLDSNDAGYFSTINATVTTDIVGPPDASVYSSTQYRFTVAPDAGFTLDGGPSDDLTNITPSVLTIADGYFVSQVFSATYEGIITGFYTLEAKPSDGKSLRYPEGYQSRLALGDTVIFATSEGDAGYIDCGNSPIVAFDAGHLDVREVPSACGGAQAAYTVRAGPVSPIVVEGTIEGYLGRTDVGRTFTVDRIYSTYPQNYDGTHSALVMQLGTIPQKRGSYWAFQLAGYLAPYSMTVSSSLCGSPAYTYVPGSILLGNAPTYVNSTTPIYYWTAFTIYEGISGVVEIPLLLVSDHSFKLLSSADNLVCYR